MERIFIHEETGNKIIAINEIQAEVFAAEEGFKEVTEEKKKK